MKKVIKNIFKVIGWILLGLLILFVILTIVFACMKKSLRQKNVDILEADGFVHLVSAGDYQMNINVYGEGKHTIIAMPGSGDAVFPIDMKIFSEYLNDVTLVTVSRPGYGVTEDTKSDITTEYIVESTRTALKNAGIEEPYILMPHSMSGIYATYWENMYPEEISGVVFLDSTNPAEEEFPEEGFPKLMMNAYIAFGTFENKTGWTTAKKALFAEEDEKMFGEYAKDALAFERASVPDHGELKNCNKNMRTAWGSIKANDIPKVYISTDYESIDDAKEYLEYQYGTVDDEMLGNIYSETPSDWKKEYDRKRSEYIEQLGNCRQINIPGSHWIFEQKPEETAKVIADLIDDID